MTPDDLKIPKTRKAVTMWVHPEGRVSGSIFLFEGHGERRDAEDPLDVMNMSSPFIAVERNGGDEFRFYNKRSVVRVEYGDPDHDKQADSTTLRCSIQMMDGSLLEGTIREVLPPWGARLYDYINSEGHRFLRLETEKGNVCLLNKSYVVHIAPLETGDS
jgi:hypothetical protein